jgi:hypothetical protein
LKDGGDHSFPSTIPWLRKSIHTSKRGKKKLIDEIEAIAMIDNIFAQVIHLFLIQQVSLILLLSSMSLAMVLSPRNFFYEGPNYQQFQ